MPGDTVRERPHARSAHISLQPRVCRLDVERAAFDAGHPSDPDAQVVPSDLLPELGGEGAFGVIVERFRQSPDEECLLLPPALCSEDRRRLHKPSRGELGALGCTDSKRRKWPWGRNGAPQLLQRQLGIEQFGVGRSALEIGHGLGVAPGRLRCLAGPVEPLRQHLERPAAAGVAVEHEHGIGSPIETAPCRGSAEPHQTRIFVADAEGAVCHVDARQEGFVGLAGDVVGNAPLAVLRGAIGEQQHHVHEPLGVRRAIGEGEVASEELACRIFPVGVPQVAGTIHHQAGVVGYRPKKGLIERLCIRVALLHRDARREGPAARRRGRSKEPLGIRRILGKQQSVNTAVIVGGREISAPACVDALFVRCAEVRRGPRLASGDQRLGMAAVLAQCVGEPGETVAALWFLHGIEGKDGRRILSRPHELLGLATHRILARPAGVVDQETGIIGETVAAIVLQSPPVVQRSCDAVAIGGSGRRRGLDRHRRAGDLRRSSRRRDEQEYYSDTPHAGHYPTALLISP